ncbi:hypothetical protein [Methylorubrum suomiense]|uniref:Uncharacterized protein n=1 Tax=Methylorubrum suomiense TaxID=144191 RepID=A0ABQ4V3W2_9HYPH|nr:hypothetical protein [Methylorubrum suomiense]GJE78664.1 hypothetical protein BGCPKDLD_5286 [Methylorubrum suomiense]
MSNRLPSMRTLPALSQVEAKIPELRGRLVPVDGQPNRFCVRRDRAVTTAERQALCAVAERLELERKAPADRNAVDVVISRVLLGFEMGRGREDVSNEILVHEYIKGLAGIPLFAIHGAGERFRSGETIITWNRAFRPSPAEFAEEARRGLFLHNLKLVHVRQILDAEVVEPPSETDRAKVEAIAANWRETRATTDAERERAHPAPAEVAQAREAHLHHLGAQLRDAADGATLGRLMGRLDAKVPRQGAEVA